MDAFDFVVIDNYFHVNYIMKRVKPINGIVFICAIFIVCNCTIYTTNIATSTDGVQIAFKQKGKGNLEVIFIHGWTNTSSTLALKSLKVPLIAINSNAIPTKVESFKKYVPPFQAKIMKDVGPLVFWDYPDKFNKLLEVSIQEFLSKK